MTSIIGHEAPIAALRGAANAGTLHHAWLFAGPEGIGKGSVARSLGADLLADGPANAALIAARSHPDYLVVEREVWDKSSPPNIVPHDQRKEGDPLARSIRVPQIRSLRGRLTTAPALGRRRIVVIDAIDDCEREGANALLKTLEEPPADTVFLLVSHAPGRLLPTIRSRCRLLRFDPLGHDDVSAVIGRLHPELAAAEAAALAAASGGAPGRGLRLAGLDVAALDTALTAIARDGDPANARRSSLAKTLGVKAAQPRYELFLERATAFLAGEARRRSGPALAAALDAHAAARELAGAALGLSLDAAATVFEMAGIVAGVGVAAEASPTRR